MTLDSEGCVITRGQTLDASLIAEIASKAPRLSRDDRETLIACLTACMKRHGQRRFFLFYPDTGPLRQFYIEADSEASDGWWG